MHKNYLAIDIGASSGRHIVGWVENGVLRTEEVYRFPNSVQRVDGHLEWDIDSLFANVKQGIREAFAKYPEIESLSIDTWAVDYVLLKNGQPLSPVYAYRDSRTQLEKAIVAYIDYYYNRRIKLKLNGLSPVQYRIQTVGAA